MSIGIVAGARRRSGGAPSNLLTNGDFSSGTTGWSGLGSGGKAVTSGKAVFTSVSAYNGISQTVTLTAAKYYEVTYTVSGYSVGNVQCRLSGGTEVEGTWRNSNGTFTQRLLAATGNNLFVFYPGDPAPNTFTLDDISVFGPYTTSTIGGA